MNERLSQVYCHQHRAENESVNTKHSSFQRGHDVCVKNGCQANVPTLAFSRHCSGETTVLRVHLSGIDEIYTLCDYDVAIALHRKLLTIVLSMICHTQGVVYECTEECIASVWNSFTACTDHLEHAMDCARGIMCSLSILTKPSGSLGESDVHKLLDDNAQSLLHCICGDGQDFSALWQQSTRSGGNNFNSDNDDAAEQRCLSKIRANVVLHQGELICSVIHNANNGLLHAVFGETSRQARAIAERASKECASASLMLLITESVKRRAIACDNCSCYHLNIFAHDVQMQPLSVYAVCDLSWPTSCRHQPTTPATQPTHHPVATCCNSSHVQTSYRYHDTGSQECMSKVDWCSSQSIHPCCIAINTTSRRAMCNVSEHDASKMLCVCHVTAESTRSSNSSSMHKEDLNTPQGAASPSTGEERQDSCRPVNIAEGNVSDDGARSRANVRPTRTASSVLKEISVQSTGQTFFTARSAAPSSGAVPSTSSCCGCYSCCTNDMAHGYTVEQSSANINPSSTACLLLAAELLPELGTTQRAHCYIPQPKLATQRCSGRAHKSARPASSSTDTAATEKDETTLHLTPHAENSSTRVLAAGSNRCSAIHMHGSHGCDNHFRSTQGSYHGGVWCNDSYAGDARSAAASCRASSALLLASCVAQTRVDGVRNVVAGRHSCIDSHDRGVSRCARASLYVATSCHFGPTSDPCQGNVHDAERSSPSLLSPSSLCVTTAAIATSRTCVDTHDQEVCAANRSILDVGAATHNPCPAVSIDCYVAMTTSDTTTVMNSSMTAHTSHALSEDAPQREVRGVNGDTYVRSDRVLGKGSSGVVYLGMHSCSGTLVAIKYVPLSCDTTVQRGIEAEVTIMQCARDCHVVELITYARSKHTMVLIMECMLGGSLQRAITDFGILPLGLARVFMRDVLRGLNTIHSLNIIHRDVKPHNVLLSLSGGCKITDFGTAAWTQHSVECRGLVVGTPVYLAPEAARGDPCKESDIWSCGVMFAQMITGRLPYTPEQLCLPAPILVYQIGSGMITPTIPPTLTDRDAALITCCLHTNPQIRVQALKLVNEGLAD